MLQALLVPERVISDHNLDGVPACSKYDMHRESHLLYTSAASLVVPKLSFAAQCWRLVEIKESYLDDAKVRLVYTLL